MGVLGNIRQDCALLIPPGLTAGIYITKRNEVTAITAAVDNEISGASAFTMATTPAAGTWKFIGVSAVPGKKTLDTVKVGDDDSTGLQPTYVGYIPGISVDRNEVQQLNGCEWLVVVVDNKGNRHLLGDLNEGCRIKCEQKIDENVNGYPLEVKGPVRGYFPYMLNSNVTLTLAAD